MNRLKSLDRGSLGRVKCPGEVLSSLTLSLREGMERGAKKQRKKGKKNNGAKVYPERVERSL